MERTPYTLEAYKAGKKAVTRDGRKVTELYYLESAINNDQRFMGVVDGTLSCWSDNGMYLHSGYKNGKDLLVLPESLTVELTPLLIATVSKDEVRLIHKGFNLGAESFPLSKIDELAAAKREVEK